jgi:hypothetical protein
MVEPHGEYKMSGNQRVYERCPSCGKAWKCYQSEDNGAWLCFSCGAKGRVPVQLSDASKLLAKFRPAEPTTWYPRDLPEWKPLGNMARRWLAGRGVHKPEQFGIVEMEGAPRVIIPYYDKHGEIIYWNTRAYRDDGRPKYLTAPGRHPLYVLPDWEKRDEVVIVEGVFDAIVHWLYTGIATVALGGKSLPDYNRRDLDNMANGRRVVMFDNDGTAVADAWRVAKSLGATLSWVPHGQDPAEFFGRIINNESLR